MKFLQSIVLLVLVCSFAKAKPSAKPPASKNSTLKLVHVLFRHGNRNPNKVGLWSGNEFTDLSYYPEGFSQLTNDGKRTEYNLGKLLRKRYDSFLGDIWNINFLDVRTTDVNRTKMSVELVLAGLWPPKGSNVWNPELPWQPIPYNYYSSEPVLSGTSCSGYTTEYDAVLASDEMQSYLSERYGATMEIINENTGLAVDSYITAGFSYYDTMKVQEAMGLPLPEWTNAVYPEPLHSLAVDIYYIWTNTTTLRKYAAGNLVGKILTDTQSLINGTLSPSERKMFLYSAHDTNVGTLVPSLGGYKLTNCPPYGSSVIFEVHEINGVYGLKLFYVDYTEGSPHPMVLPGCDDFCPLDEFYTLVEEILPTSDMTC